MHPTHERSTAESHALYLILILQGSVLIFQHDILHEGSELLSGKKYAVRTDVMYEAGITQDKTLERDMEKLNI